MDDDFLNTEFDQAARRLEKAIQECGSGACTGRVLGKLHVALGEVYGIGKGRLDLAQEHFVAARRADATAPPNFVVTTPELTRAFNEARRITNTP